MGDTLSRRALEPAVVFTDLPNEAELLLCSDGLTDLLSNDEIVGVLARNSQDPAEALVRAAKDAGGHDKITAVIVRPQFALG